METVQNAVMTACVRQKIAEEIMSVQMVITTQDTAPDNYRLLGLVKNQTVVQISVLLPNPALLYVELVRLPLVRKIQPVVKIRLDRGIVARFLTEFAVTIIYIVVHLTIPFVIHRQVIAQNLEGVILYQWLGIPVQAVVNFYTNMYKIIIRAA
jgi:hypothetical protein